jgi:uncharacterized repeat protein (TIGR01451 family)
MRKQIISSILLGILTFSFPKPTLADGLNQCQPIYGGGINCNQDSPITINKKIQNPTTKTYIERLNLNDPKYQPGQIVPFQIILTNPGKSTISNITAKDILPAYLDYDSGDGNYDTKTKTITFSLNELKPNETKNFFYKTKTTTIDKDILCTINLASVTANGQTSQDNSQLCIQKPTPTPTPIVTITNNTTKGGLPVFQPKAIKKTPPTGPENLSLIAPLIAGAIGIYIRQKTQKITIKKI